MKHTAITALFLLMGLAVPGSVDAKNASVGVPAEGAGTRVEPPRQEIWDVERRGRDIYFYLRQQDLGRDFAVFRTGGRAKGEWQLLRWVMKREKIVLLTVSGRQEELLPDWTQAATSAAEFPVVPATDDRYRIRVTSLFGRAFPSGWGRSDGLAGSGTVRFGAPRSFPRNVVVPLMVEAGKEETGAAQIRWNFVKLPERRMATRRLAGPTPFQPRGHWQANYPWKLAPDEVALRWRLEGPAHAGAGVEPASPIVIHVDPATPERWRRWVAAGIESWQPAFAAIGYPRAVRAVITTDADAMDYDDVRNSVLCWKSRKRGCEGNVFDPRTGELLQYHMSGQDHALEGYLARYIVALAAVDPRVFETPLPDALLGALVQKVAAHETGHLLGLKDGTYGTFIYTPAQVRNRAWVMANGFSPSIMNYARFNFLAQPEDGMPADLLIQKPGPADLFWIRWGYGHDAQDVIEQAWNGSPLYRYGKEDGTLDPYSGVETPGVSDPVAGARLGMRNLERSIAMLGGHVFREADPEIARLIDARSLYEAALTQWFVMHRQVLSLVGGQWADSGKNSSRVEDHTAVTSRGSGPRPVDADRQKEAVQFLCESFFSNTPGFLLEGPIVQAAGLDRKAVESLIAKKRDALFLQELASGARLNRMIRLSGEAKSLKDPYGVVNLMRDMQGCVVR